MTTYDFPIHNGSALDYDGLRVVHDLAAVSASHPAVRESRTHRLARRVRRAIAHR